MTEKNSNATGYRHGWLTVICRFAGVPLTACSLNYGRVIICRRGQRYLSL